MISNKQKKEAFIDDTSFNYTLVVILAIALLIVLTAIYLVSFVIAGSEGNNISDGNDITNTGEVYDYPFRVDISVKVPDYSESSATLVAKNDVTEGLYSEFAALVDLTTGKMIATKKAQKQIYPASMTKVMTLIVVYENLKSESSINDTVKITKNHINAKIRDQLSGDLYQKDTLTVEDMIYALMLKSDGIAALCLAEYIAGSEEAFVALMNEKASDMGLLNTSFANCTGIHDENNYTTCQDMATIMAYAMQNPYCANVMSTTSYRTVTDVYTDGITFFHSLLVTKFEQELPHLNFESVTVTAGKTGWTGEESGRCLVSYAVGNNGHKYVLVTAGAPNKNEEALDHEYIYNLYAK